MLSYSEIDLRFEKFTNELQNSGIRKVWDYLSERGITLSDIDALGLHICTARDLIVAARGGGSALEDGRLAIVFPHTNLSGQHIDWWSARLVETDNRPLPSTSFGSLVDKKKLGKMFCPPAEPPHAYLPPILDWQKIAPGSRVYIHESCIKAVNGAKMGYWSIGLNGVWGWCSRKHSIALVDELKSLPWKSMDLRPVIVFDSNAADNWDVQHAISALASKIFEITGKVAKHILLPPGPEGHWGFDDFVKATDPGVVHDYLNQEGTDIPISGIDLLKLQLNEECCVVRNIGRIAEQNTGTIMTRGAFVDVNFAHYNAYVDDKLVNVPRVWLADTRRREVDRIEYLPGGDLINEEYLNLWRGMPLEPKSGDPKPWLDLLARNVHDEKLRKWFLQWLAYPLQHVGAKLTTFVHMWGPPGAGKQAILAPVMRIYGKNAVMIGKQNVDSSFNHIWAARQFINIDELPGGAGNDRAAFAMYNRIKMFTTSDKVVVNKKGEPEYEIKNCAQVVTTSNYLDSLKLDEDDRRCCVIRYGTRGQVDYGEEYWLPYWKWINDEGSEIVYDFLLNVNMDGFEPQGWAPGSEDKQEVMRASLSREQAWVRDLWVDPENVLGPAAGRKCLYTTKELGILCFGEDPLGVTPGKLATLGIRMNEAGFGKIELKIDGKKERVWIVRGREEKWTAENAREHLRGLGKGKF